MKYGLGLRMLFSFVFGGIAVLYKLSLGTAGTSSEVSVLVPVPQNFLFDFISEASNVPKYFSWISRLRAGDKRRAVIGQLYRGTLNMPFLGQHEIEYRVADCQEGAWLVFRPRDKDRSYFNTEVSLVLSSVNKAQTQFYMKIKYGRHSALFKYTIGPLLKWLTDKQLEKVGASVRTLAVSKWIKLAGGGALVDGAPAKREPVSNETAKYIQQVTEGSERSSDGGVKTVASVRKFGDHHEEL